MHMQLCFGALEAKTGLISLLLNTYLRHVAFLRMIQSGSS